MQRASTGGRHRLFFMRTRPKPSPGHPGAAELRLTCRTRRGERPRGSAGPGGGRGGCRRAFPARRLRRGLEGRSAAGAASGHAHPPSTRRCGPPRSPRRPGRVPTPLPHLPVPPAAARVLSESAEGDSRPPAAPERRVRGRPPARPWGGELLGGTSHPIPRGHQKAVRSGRTCPLPGARRAALPAPQPGDPIPRPALGPPREPARGTLGAALRPRHGRRAPPARANLARLGGGGAGAEAGARAPAPTPRGEGRSGSPLHSPPGAPPVLPSRARRSRAPPAPGPRRGRGGGAGPAAAQRQN